jgi:leucyl-tRNA synthetase
MRAQLRSMGAMFDWDREAVSSEPSYYQWTEWFFKRLSENDIAYRAEALVNWSETLQTVLANEQVIDGKDERTGQPVVQKMMEQWFFAITNYVDELLEFDHIDWPDPIKTMQTNWIGRSEGAEVTFTTEHGDEIAVFTTRPDTLWGATFMVLAPEHPLVDSVTSTDHRQSVDDYRAVAAGRSELERMEVDREKTGVFTGGYAVNPVNQEQIPIWIADYVLLTYGTGAIMAVPAHDQRDFEFARQFGLRIAPVITPAGRDAFSADAMVEAYVGPGVMVNSGPIDGVETTDAKGRENPSIAAAIDWLETSGAGSEAINYRLRDWLISRQRYWGAPIPMIHRADGTIEAVPDEELPVILPEDVEFEGRSPLATTPSFVETTDSTGAPARRETDTMDTFMCSSWYWFRYLSPHYDEGPFDPEEAAYWLPVDVYTGGAEHAVMHLLYARFFVKAMRDIGVFDEVIELMEQHGRDPAGLFDEPFLMLRNQGQILGEERRGDHLVIDGHRDGERVVAAAVRVDQAAGPNDGDVVGELWRRTENLLQVKTGAGVTTVEVPDAATVDIAQIPGTNDVTQLKHHLEVERMSKSKGNTVNPDDLVEKYGADTVRTYLMFAFDWEKGGPWDSQGILGSHRFIQDVWALATVQYDPAEAPSGEASQELRRSVHQTMQKVDHDMLGFKWNTAIAALMKLRNTMTDALQAAHVDNDAWSESVETLLKLLAPIAPHVTEELWYQRGHEQSVHVESWPEWDPDLLVEDTVTMVVQVNGKVRDRVEVRADIGEDDAIEVALNAERVQSWTEGKTVHKVIARQPKLVNIVVG